MSFIFVFLLFDATLNAEHASMIGLFTSIRLSADLSYQQAVLSVALGNVYHQQPSNQDVISSMTSTYSS